METYDVYNFGDFYVGFRRLDENKIKGFMIEPNRYIEDREEFRLELLLETRDWYALEWGLSAEMADLMAWAIGYLNNWDSDALESAYRRAKGSRKLFSISL